MHVHAFCEKEKKEKKIWHFVDLQVFKN